MAIIYENMIIDGVGYGRGVFCIGEDGRAYESKFVVSDGTQGLKTEQIMVCTNKPQYYIFGTIHLDSSAKWRIYGTSSIINREIHLSTQIDGTDALLASELAVTKSDVNGEYSFEAREDLPSDVYVWYNAPFTYDNIRTQFIDVNAEAIIPNQTLIRYAIFNTVNSDTCPACGGSAGIYANADFPMITCKTNSDGSTIEVPPFPEDVNNYDFVCITGTASNPRLYMTNFEVRYDDGTNNNGTAAYGFLDGNIPTTECFWQVTKNLSTTNKPFWQKTTSAEQGFSTLIWTKTPIYDTTGALHIAASDPVETAVVCNDCGGTGQEPIYNNTGYVTCRACDGDGGIKVNNFYCPRCYATGIVTARGPDRTTEDGLFKYPKCVLTGTGPDLSFNSYWYISYWPDEAGYPTDITSNANNLLTLNNNVVYQFTPSSTSLNMSFDESNMTYSSTAAGSTYANHIFDDEARWVIWTSGTDPNARNFSVTANTYEGGQPSNAGSSTPCLPGETLIATPNGDVRLDSLVPGDIVLSSTGPTTVIHNLGPEAVSKYIKYYFSNGTIIKETAPHAFFNVDKGVFLQLTKWDIGDHALDINNNSVELMHKEVCNEPSEKYSLFTEQGDYYANGLLNGSTLANKRFIASATGEQMLNIAKSLELNTILQGCNMKRGFLP